MSKTNLSHRVKQTLLLLCLMCSAFGLKAAVVTPEANKTYFIVNKQTGCVLSNGNSTNTDSPIYCLTREENNYGQRWTMELVSDNVYAFRNELSRMASTLRSTASALAKRRCNTRSTRQTPTSSAT